MLTITTSSDSYYDSHPLTLGILVRGDLAATWDLVEEVKQASPEMPVIISCTSSQADSSRKMLHQFSRTMIIQHHQARTPGEVVNEIMERSRSAWTSVCWSDMRVQTDRFLSPPADDHLLCRVPVLVDASSNMLPRTCIPFGRDEHIGFAPLQEGVKTIMPFDYAGIYDTLQFRSIGGYADRFMQPFWQLVDFGSRAWLWGYSLEISDALRLQYQRRFPVYDQTRDLDYYRWYRRNCSMKRVRGILKHTRTFLHQRAAEERQWVADNQHRFMRSMEEVISRWDELSH